MAQITCVCGTKLSDFEAPNDIQLVVYTDKEWDKICDCDRLEPWKIPLPAYDVWRCPVCKRIYVYERGSSLPLMCYSLEEG